VTALCLLLLFAFIYGGLTVVCDMLDWRPLLLLRDRLNCIFGYPLLILIDCVIGRSSQQEWLEIRRSTDEVILELWNRNRKQS
jgi:hypothetical protein